jgi:hypothetical protein
MNKDHKLYNVMQWAVDRDRGIQMPAGATTPARGDDDKESGSCVYFIQSGPYVKIGIADNPSKRINELQTGNPMALVLLRSFRVMDARRIERSLHAHFDAVRVRGEWFDLSDDDRDRISKADTILDVVTGAVMNV